MSRIALFPGSFDPITLGHVDIIERAVPLFDEIKIAVGTNSAKNCLFSLEQRVHWIEQTFAHEPKISVITYEGTETVHQLVIGRELTGINAF